MRIALALLNRNEEEAVPVVVPQLPLAAVDYVFAVDGNSTDCSPAMLEQQGVHVLGQGSPGRGEAFRLAFEHARDRADAIIFFSPDGNEAPGDVRRFRALLEGGADMVIASRMMRAAVNEEDGRRFRPRKWANLLFAWLAWRVWGRGQPKITDPINGYRAIRVAAWDRMGPDGSGYTIEYQCSIRAFKHKLRVAEFPTVEGQRLGGESNAKALPTGLRFLRLLWAEAIRRE